MNENKNILYFTSSGKLMITSDGKVLPIDPDRESIRWIHLLSEDCLIKYSVGEKEFVKEAHAGDLVIAFYEQSFKHPVVIVHNDEWKENITEERVKQQEAKEKWAESCEKCDNCCNPV